jgi:uncharacterized protein YjiS (DUF1127 family)
MTTAFAAADFAGSSPNSGGVTARITAAIAAALARAKERHDCRQLLACDDILRDAGVTRDDVRQMLMGNGRL